MGYLTRQEAAERLSISVRTVDGLIRRGQLPAYRLGPRLVRIKEEDLSRILDGRQIAPAAVRPAGRPCLYVPGMKVVGE